MRAKEIGKLALGLLLAGLGVLAFGVLLLLFPNPLFAHSERFGSYRVYSDEPIGPDVAGVIDEVALRVQAMDHGSAPGDQRVFLCHSPRRYRFFAFLTRKNPDTLAIGLSVANETFVSMDRVRLFADENPGVFRHTRFEGNLAEVIAHEIAHFTSVQVLGYREHLAQPMWKSEGWAEYQANAWAIHEDPRYDLRQRIDLLLDDAYWGGSGLAREQWESQLLVEYLGEVEGLGLTDLSRPEITRPSTRERMLEWYRLRPRL